MENIKYCYLDKVFTDVDDNSLLYHITMSDDIFSKIYSAIVDRATLMQYATNNSIIKDFSVKDDFLYCVEVPRIVVTGDILAKKNIVEEIYTEQNTFYAFIREGIENKYQFIDDDVIECDKYRGVGVAPFANIHFSRSTMTALIYFDRVASGQFERNSKMLITVHEGVLKLEEFYFIAPIDVHVPHYNIIKEIEINNVRYNAYKSKQLNIYTENYVASSPMLNKMCIMREKYQAIVNTLSDFKKSLQGAESASTVWTGGSKDYKENYGVYFKPDCFKMTKQKREEVIYSIHEDILNVARTYDEALQLVKEKYPESITRGCASVLCFVCYNSDSESNLLEYIYAVLQKYKADLLNIDLALYTVRTGAYIRNRHLVPIMHPVLEGSDERYVTIVEQKFKRSLI